MRKITAFVDEKLFPFMLYASTFFVLFAFVTQVTFAGMNAFASEERVLEIANKMTWKFDGNFKNHPDNIFYEGDAAAK